MEKHIEELEPVFIGLTPEKEEEYLTTKDKARKFYEKVVRGEFKVYKEEYDPGREVAMEHGDTLLGLSDNNE